MKMRVGVVSSAPCLSVCSFFSLTGNSARWLNVRSLYRSSKGLSWCLGAGLQMTWRLSQHFCLNHFEWSFSLNECTVPGSTLLSTDAFHDRNTFLCSRLVIKSNIGFVKLVIIFLVFVRLWWMVFYIECVWEKYIWDQLVVFPYRSQSRDRILQDRCGPLIFVHLHMTKINRKCLSSLGGNNCGNRNRLK